MAERYSEMSQANDGEDDPRTGKEVGDFDYDSGDSEPALEGQPYWVRFGDGDSEGWLTPREDGSFQFEPDGMLGRDCGPTDRASTPDEIQLDVYNPPGDYDQYGNEIDGSDDGYDAGDWWEAATYRPREAK